MADDTKINPPADHGRRSTTSATGMADAQPPTMAADNATNPAAGKAAEEKKKPLTEIPLDVLLLIVPHLDAPSFLSLCRTCTAFYSLDFRLDSAYWSHVTRTTFRVPNQPVAEADGRRWQMLYKRLLTQTCVFTWGANSRGALGQEAPGEEDDPSPRGAMRGRGALFRRARPYRLARRVDHVTHPVEMHKSKDLGVIADLQCGGWSTTLLNSKGVLYTVGVMDGLQSVGGSRELVPLKYPAGFPRPVDREEPAVTIRQFSSGRSHVLGLSDSGRIWSWYSVTEPAWHIKFLHHETLESRRSSAEASAGERGFVRQVVAGWSVSSACVTGTGILLWKIANRKCYPSDAENDMLEIGESVVVPQTDYLRPERNARDPDDATRELGEKVGEVVNHIVLEHFVVFVTDLGKFFAAKMSWDDDTTAGHVEDIVELVALRDTTAAAGAPTKVDVQGSFRSFAAFKNGEVITAKQDYLDVCWNSRLNHPDNSEVEGLKRIPALQHTGVISLSFGDYHYLALKNDGTIISFGTEPQACGALGLGGGGDAEGRLRGIRYQGLGGDGKLVQHAYTSGRRVWFEEVKRQWIRFLASGGKDPGEAMERMRMAVTNPTVQGEVSEWIEQQGTDWDKHPDLADANEDGLGGHFALNVAAAGWHSGALVLVNEKLAERVRERCIVKEEDMVKENEEARENGEGSSAGGAGQGNSSTSNAPRIDVSAFNHPENHGASPGKGLWYTWAGDSFPRLKLSNGEEMPGREDVPFMEWKYGRPEWELNQDF